LRTLDLTDSRVGGAGAAILAKWPRPSPLGTLSLENTDLNRSAFVALSQGTLLDGIRELNLGLNAPTGAGVAAVMGHSGTAALRVLDFGGCELSDDEVTIITSTEPASHLETLRLGDNRLTTASFEALVKAPFAGVLTELDLRWNRIDDSIMDILSHHPCPPQLRLLYLFGNALSPATVERLKTWGPQTEPFAASLTNSPPDQ
jgi:hypothetical protein